MAKMIACPTCGENVEIPPGAAGQMVKCAACGTAIKLVSRKKPGGGSGPGASNADTMSSTGAFAGSSYSAPSSISNWASDDPPSLGECAQCGSVLADPSQLIEDRGRLICPNCAAKSPVSQREDVHSYRPRPGNADAAPTIGFKEPDTVIARHGPFISFDLMTILGAFAGAVAIGASIWLMFHPKPIGTNDLSAKPIPVLNVPPPVSATTDISDDEKRRISEALVRASNLEKQGDSAESLNAALDAYNEVTKTVGAKVLSDPALRDGIDTARARIPVLEKRIAELATPATTIARIDVPPAPIVIEPPAPATVPATVPEEPATEPAFIFAESAEDVFDTTELLSLGMHALRTYDYELARDSFLKAQKQLGGRDANEQYQPEQVLVMHGLGSAYLGLNQARLAYEPLNRAYKNTPEAPSLTTNWCLANYLLDQQRPESLLALESALQQEPTETGVDLMEAMITKWGRALTPEAKTRLEAARTSAMRRLEAQHPKQKRWGDVWISAEAYDERVRNEVLITVLSEKVSVLNEQVRRAEMVYRTAQDRNRDVAEAKERLDNWKEELEKIQKELEVTQANVPERALKAGMRPVIPEVPPGVLLREE